MAPAGSVGLEGCDTTSPDYKQIERRASTGGEQVLCILFTCRHEGLGGISPQIYERNNKFDSEIKLMS